SLGRARRESAHAAGFRFPVFLYSLPGRLTCLPGDYIMLSAQLDPSGSFRNRAALLIVAILLTACGLSAQTFRGGIQGTVFDSSGAGVPDAEVVVLGTETNLSRHTATDGAGNYAFTELPLGAYSVTATK